MKKILLIRFSSIGDIVLTSPIVRAIKQQTNNELHILTKTSYKVLFEENPNVDKVHSFIKSTDECISVLKNEKFDVIIDLQKNIRSHKLKKELKVANFSFPKLNIQKWFLVNFKINRLPNVHIVDRYFEAVVSLGVKNDMKGLDYFIPKSDEVDIKKLNSELTDGYIGFVIGGQHTTKILPVDICVKIISKLDLPVVLLGGKDDIDRSNQIVNLSTNKKIISTCGSFNINQSASLVKQASAIITNDTGLMHISAAFNKPIISIWGNTVPEFGMYPYMPEHKSNYIISEVKGLSCRPCSKIGYEKCPKKHFNCMMEQDVNIIVENITKYLD